MLYDKEVDLWEYKVYEDGRIFGVHGKQINKNKQIKIKWGINGDKKNVSYARFVYYAFNYKNFDFDNKNIIIKHKNGDENDYNINNLIAVERKDYNQGENSASAKLTNEQAEEIKRLYGKNMNVRSDLNDPKAKISYRKLAEKYGVSHTTIRGIIKGYFRNKDNYKS